MSVGGVADCFGLAEVPEPRRSDCAPSAPRGPSGFLSVALLPPGSLCVFGSDAGGLCSGLPTAGPKVGPDPANKARLIFVFHNNQGSSPVTNLTAALAVKSD